MARRRLVRITSLAAIGFAVWWWRRRASADTAAPASLSAPTASATPAASANPPAWVEPVDGACPPGYPIKLNLQSGIFHEPGGRSYERTVPGRCYASVDAAEADGYRRAKA
jgi:hypothetical protein